MIENGTQRDLINVSFLNPSEGMYSQTNTVVEEDVATIDDGKWQYSMEIETKLDSLSPVEPDEIVQRKGSNSTEHSVKLNRNLSDLSGTVHKSATVAKMHLRKDLKFLETLGEGCFGIVELHNMVHEFGETQKVALKKLKVLEGTSPTQVEEFIREIRLQAKIKHPNIVAALGLGTYPCPVFGELPFVVQELMKMPLSRALKMKFPIETRLNWCLDIAKALLYMHTSTPILIHRDIKPSNILISYDNTAKISDLGLFTALKSDDTLEEMTGKRRRRNSIYDEQSHKISEQTDDAVSEHKKAPVSSSDPKSRRKKGLTRHRLSFLDNTQSKTERRFPTGMTGTLIYMAPENFNGRMYSEKVDQYSFAMLMYAIMNCGEAYTDHAGARLHPYHIALSASKAGGIRPRIPKRWPGPIKTLIADCWDFDPDKRPSFETIVAILTEFLAEDQTAVPAAKNICMCFGK